MKKILSAVAAVVLAAALISCGDSGDTYTANADTVLSVGTPVVTGKAYPGVNYITWTPVANATRYEIYRTAGNAATEYLTAVSAQTSDLGYADFASDNKDLVDGVTYKYTIFAVGGNYAYSTNVPSRAVYAATSTASATVKAKVPAYGTDLTKFAEVAPNDADYKKIGTYLSELSAKKGVLEAKNVNNTHIAVAYPVIAGLKYAVKAVNASHLAAGLSTTKETVSENFTSEFVGDRTANCNLKAVSAYGPGKYTVYLTVSPLSSLYTTEAVYSLGEVTFAELDDTTKIANVNATWASDGKSVNLTWEQAKLANGSKEAITNYHVYRAVGAYTEANFKEGVEITEVTKDVKVVSKLDATAAGYIGSGNTVDAASNLTEGKLKEVCYMVDATADANTPYTYIVTHTNNNGVSKPVFSNSLTTWSKETTDVPSFVTDGNNKTEVISRKDKENTVIKVVGKRANTYQTLSLAYYKLDEVKSGTYKKLITSDFSAGTINSNNDATNETWTGYIEATVGTYVLKLTATDSRGKAEASAYYVIYVTGVGAPDASGINIYQQNYGTKSMAADNMAYVVDNNLSSADFDAKTYKYYLTTVTIKQANTTFSDDVTIETSTSAIDLAKHATVTTSTEANDSYVAYGFMDGGVAATDTKYTAIVSGVKSETASSGTAIRKVYSVKKTRASDEANLYAYSLNKITK